MRKSSLQLDSVFYTNTSVRAIPRKLSDAEETTLPRIAAAAFVESETKFAVMLSIKLGDEQKSRYVVELDANGHFSMPIFPGEESSKSTPQKWIADHIMTGARTVYSAARDYLASLTARGPYGEIFLPMLMIDDADVDVHLSKKVEHLAPKDLQPEAAVAKKRPTKKPTKLIR